MTSKIFKAMENLARTRIATMEIRSTNCFLYFPRQINYMLHYHHCITCIFLMNTNQIRLNPLPKNVQPIKAIHHNPRTD